MALMAGLIVRWQNRHNVCIATLSGEAADVDPAVVDDWSGHVSSICTGYCIEDTFNADETGLFFRALPTHLMVVSGGKKSKDRISVLLACSAAGEKLKLFVIGRSARPCCFRGLTSPLCLPVMYKSNRKAWMTSNCSGLINLITK